LGNNTLMLSASTKIQASASVCHSFFLYTGFFFRIPSRVSLDAW
jgi:hypothetical protein